MTIIKNPSRDAIFERLDNVYDPELDDSVLRLGFIDDVEIEGSNVTVHYKLPTFWCSPNFAFMMSYDIRSEVLQVPGVRSVTVLLRNNCAAEEINGGVNSGRSFQETFPEDTDEDLDALRRKFIEKSFLARQDVLIRRLRQAGLNDEHLLALQLDEVRADDEDVVAQPAGAKAPLRVRLAASDLAKYLRRRANLGLPSAPDALLFTSMSGIPLRELDLTDYLRRSRAARLNIAFNTTLCEGLLRATYNPEHVGNTASLGDALLVF